MTTSGAAGPVREDDAFEAWRAREYLADYYTRVDEDEVHTLAFLARELRRRGRVATRALAFGVGPTAHHLLALAPWADAIDVADYLNENLRELQRWLRHEARAHDWSAFAAHVLACEGEPRVDAAAVDARQALTRRRVARLLPCDASRHPAVSTVRGDAAVYDLVMSCYCAESATADKATWARYMRNILRLVRPGGLLLLAALRRCRGYTVGRALFPAAFIDERDLSQLLDEAAFDEPHRRSVEVRMLDSGPLHGYEGIMLLACERRQEEVLPAACAMPGSRPFGRASHGVGSAVGSMSG